ncbi:FlxA-like family protein [Alicyclobacillus shizuokensis]|uniref:FlxA-like family protein n=1 Tax=Alicyclobacillus shizuokensis TaxID=392014 RepID=UPI00082FCED1|nr:FlxA-like family protein [Alicyclobacillus shizuokensis]
MLIGYTKTVAELRTHINNRINDIKMQINEMEKELRDLEADIRYNPPERGVPDDRLKDRIRLSTEIDDLQNDLAWLQAKLEEAENSQDQNQSVYLSLNDCIRLGVTEDEEA